MSHENLPQSQYVEMPVARELAEVELPIRNAAFLLRSAGVEIAADQVHTAANKASDEALAKFSPVGAVEQAESEQAPAAYDRERIRGILDRSPVLVNTWMHTNTIPAENQSTTAGQFKTIFNGQFSGQFSSSEADRFLTARTDDKQMAEFAANHVPELVTFIPVPAHMLGKGATEPKVMLSYETVTRSTEYSPNDPTLENYKRGYLDAIGPGRPGNYMQAQVLLSETEAADMKQAIIEDPKLIRDVVGTMMLDTFKTSPEDWKSMGPQYDKWREADDGVSKIAVRDTRRDGPANSQILEF